MNSRERVLAAMLIECGVDILNPVQTSAAGMDPRKLKAEFGDRLVFLGWWHRDADHAPFGSLDEICGQVQERIGIFGSGGGFVFVPIHNIQADVSADRLIAMYQAVHDYGQYLLR